MEPVAPDITPSFNKIFKILKRALTIIINWLFIIPLSLIIPKRKNLIVFVGQLKGQFKDNCKYLFLYANTVKEKNNLEIYFLTEDMTTFQELKKARLPALYFFSFSTVIKLLRAKISIHDNNVSWFMNLKYPLLFNTVKILLWHGVGFKKIGKMMYSMNTKSNILKFMNKIKSLYCYDLFISTSKFYTDNVFRKSFNAKEILTAGYPRNDSFHIKNDAKILIGTDISKIKKIIRLKSQGYKNILYAPTFRDTGTDYLFKKVLDLNKFSEFLYKNKLVFIMKFHQVSNMKIKTPYDNILIYDNSKDVYPLLPYIDLLITDYSSIYMDYLILNKPVIFFPYDYHTYIRRDREIQFDYNEFTPGPKCFDQTSLEKEIINLLINKNDYYKEQRRKLLDVAFKYNKDVSEKVWDYIVKKFILK